MTIDDLLKPKPEIHDYGVDTITENEKVILHSLIGKLKEQIWP